MLLDNFYQIALPCLLVLFGNEWRTLLSVEGVPGEWLEVEMLEKGFVLGGVDFHFTLLTRYLESQVYQSVVDNLASEQAARMVAMKADNFKELNK